VKAHVLPRCSFCGKTQHDVRKLISGPAVYICDECVELCNDIIAEEWATVVWEERGRIQTSEGRPEPAASGGPLEIRHTPVSRQDVPKDLIDRLRQPLESHSRFFRFYRTDVTNNTDRPIRIIWFDGLFSHRGQWTASNVRNGVLRTRDFIDWYGGDGLGPAGWLQAGGTATCRVNWHFTETLDEVPTQVGLSDGRCSGK